MTAKQYLMEVHKLRRRITSLELQQEELRTKAEGLRAIVYDKDKVQTSVQNRFDTIMTELVTVQAEYAKSIAECYAAIAVREKKIAALTQPRYVDVLRMRYIEQDKGRQLTLSQIARQMGYSFDRTAHLHREALEQFRKKYKLSKQ